MKELCGLGAVELRDLMLRGEVSAREVTIAHIERIQTVNERLNAVAVPLFVSFRQACVKA
jgi:Asp-tRNA(Asn)/Glu-tRNA(Gln) amidotransferase A subunit family amidase